MDTCDIHLMEFDVGKRLVDDYKHLIEDLIARLGKPATTPIGRASSSLPAPAPVGGALPLPLYTTPLVPGAPTKYIVIHLHKNNTSDVFIRIRTHDVYVIAYGIKTTIKKKTRIVWKELRDGNKKEHEIKGSDFVPLGCNYTILESEHELEDCTFSWDGLDRALYSLAMRNTSEKSWKNEKISLLTIIVTFSESARFKPIFEGISHALADKGEYVLIEQTEYKMSHRDRSLISCWGDISELRASEEKYSSKIKDKLRTIFGEEEDLIALTNDLALGNGTAIANAAEAKRVYLEKQQAERTRGRQNMGALLMFALFVVFFSS